MPITTGQAGILFSCFVAWFLAQATKAILYMITHRKFNLVQAIFATGGMPSGHAASVAALVTAIFLYEGLSTAFAVAAILMFVTLRDAVGVRLAAGEHAQIINELMAKANLERPALHIDHGHTTAEVVVGIVVGIVAGAIVMTLVG